MTPDEKLKMFEKYLLKRMSFERMMLAVVEHGENDPTPYQIRITLLEDIIHDFDALVNTQGDE